VLLTAKATLFWQLEDSFPLLSAEERDCIYNKSYIVYSSTSAIISRKKRHNLLLHQCHLQQRGTSCTYPRGPGAAEGAECA